MSKENVYQDLHVFYEKIEACPLRNRQFNFYELVYVLSGQGMYVVNENKVSFQANDLFITTPKDIHEFDLNGECEFIVIRFTQHYIEEYQWKTIDHLACLLYNSSHLSRGIINNSRDAKIVLNLIATIRVSLETTRLYDSDLMRNLVNAIMVVAARNIVNSTFSALEHKQDDRLLNILNYIQEHICDPERLRISHLANQFDLSETYLGGYFRKQCGESLQSYVSKYRLRLIEHRLQFSDKRVHEIADEFGFTDESHITKFFKRHNGVSLPQFRKTYLALKQGEIAL